MRTFRTCWAVALVVLLATLVGAPTARADVSVTPETVDVTLAPGGSTDVTKTLTITPPPGMAGSIDLVVNPACPVSITFSPAPPYSLSQDSHPTQTLTETIAVPNSLAPGDYTCTVTTAVTMPPAAPDTETITVHVRLQLSGGELALACQDPAFRSNVGSVVGVTLGTAGDCVSLVRTVIANEGTSSSRFITLICQDPAALAQFGTLGRCVSTLNQLK
jgi:hypothetical protein